MKVSRYEKLVNERRLSPVSRQTINDHIVLIADGWLEWHPERTCQHYQTMWAVGRDEDRLQICRPLYFDGPIGSSSQAERIAAAIKDAREFAEGLNGRAHG